MNKNITVGIDIGTHTTRVVVTESRKGEIAPRIIGVGSSETFGMRLGYVRSAQELSSSIKKAVKEAEKSSGQKIKKAYFSIGSIGLESFIGSSSSIISKSDSRISTQDITKAINESQEQLSETNKKILQIIPIQFKLDGKKIFGKPEGMQGTKLDVKTLFISVSEQYIDELISSAEKADLEVVDIIASPVALSRVTLTDRQKMSGCVLVDIGAETVTASVFEDGVMINTWVSQIGSSDITNDISLVFKINRDEAENLKIGSFIADYSKKKLDDIVEARLSDIFELIDKQLKKIGRSGLLPGGVVLVGGGAKVPSIIELAKKDLNLPAKIGELESPYSKNKIRDISWYTAYGLCTMRSLDEKDYSDQSFSSIISSIKEFFIGIGKQLLP